MSIEKVITEFKRKYHKYQCMGLLRDNAKWEIGYEIREILMMNDMVFCNRYGELEYIFGVPVIVNKKEPYCIELWGKVE